MAQKVEGKLYESITGQLFEIGRQIRQNVGYPFNANQLQKHLQKAIEGRFTYDDRVYPFNPTVCICNKKAIWKGAIDGDGLYGNEDIDPRSMMIFNIELKDIIFETCLEKEETLICGEEKLRRLKEKTGFIRFGANVLYYLCMDYCYNKRNSILERMYSFYNISSIDFMGTIIRDQSNRRNVPFLDRRCDGEWFQLFKPLDYEWDIYCPSAGCHAS